MPLDTNSSEARPARIRVDFTATAGPVLHGAAGSLYGVSEDGVPGDELLDALDITTLAVKPDGGAQHPNGDASPAVAALRRNGPGLAFVYLQDLFAAWPYEDVGIDVYHERLFAVVPPMLTEANAGRLVFVPFNEPDWIWYALSENDPSKFDRFLADWITTVQLLRGLAPGVPIAGPNEAKYHPEFLPHFLRRARDTGTLPEWMAWHELSPDSLAEHRGHHRAYRELERSLGIEPLPVNIDEYGGNRDLSVPGRLAQWAAAFEDTGVHADMAYWTAAGSYSGAAPQPNIPNGAWWFLKAYSGMTGDLARVTPPEPDTVDSLQGLATVDADRMDARILVGGADGDFTIEAVGLDPRVWGEVATATVHRIDWSGYEGAAGPPLPLAQVTGPAAKLEIPVADPDPMAAYWVTVAPGTAKAIEPAPWKGRWEAEAARITSGTVHRQGRTADGNGFAASGDYDVTELNTNDSAVEFAVEVPEAGEYDLAIFYAHMYGRGHEPIDPQPAEQVLTVNGAERFVRYPTTMNWQHRSVATEPVRLRAGANTIRLSKSGAIGTASGEATLDKIELTERRPDRTVYEGALARPVEGGRVFDLYAGVDGYHRIEGAASAVLAGPQNQHVPVDLTRPVFLHRGVNRLRTGPDAERLTVTPAEGPEPVEVLAQEATRSGGSCLVVNDFAVGGHVIGWNGRGAAASIAVEAAGGPHALLVHYANDERGKSHEYNIDVVTLHCDLTVNGAKTGRHPMRGTWTWNDFWTYPVIVELRKGANTIVFDNPDGPTADLERFRIAPLNP
ncbi:CBM35 domain-containing protein [Glycomyces sp. NRRL B-16210]|uniref:CBM35 domain-containing protein n=1 Tax=Glycomyces sp. NRRL B-16210 TaxID=1463821 RepID=UPI00054F7501|nr:CBM35 domain-containing protein [Glycomyces sp. NRRL B-16210]